MKAEIKRIVALNLLDGVDIEEELCMEISDNVLDRVMEISKISDNTTKNIVGHGAWVYSNGIEYPWIFERYDTIEDAVRRAVGLIGASVVFNGKIVRYNTVENNMVYYINPDTDIARYLRV